MHANRAPGGPIGVHMLPSPHVPYSDITQHSPLRSARLKQRTAAKVMHDQRTAATSMRCAVALRHSELQSICTYVCTTTLFVCRPRDMQISGALLSFCGEPAAAYACSEATRAQIAELINRTFTHHPISGARLNACGIFFALPQRRADPLS